jgi:hypothetical protein
VHQKRTLQNWPSPARLERTQARRTPRERTIASQFRPRLQILSIVADSAEQDFCLKSGSNLTAARSRCRTFATEGAGRPRRERLPSYPEDPMRTG